MSFMEYDSPLNEIIGKVIDIILVSTLWFLCCLPIITIGASTTALYYSVVKAIRKNRGYAVKNFFHAFRSNFIPATLLWLFYGVMAVLLYICFIFASALQSSILRNLMNIVYLFIAFVVLGMGCFSFPVLSRCSMKCGAIIRFSFGLLVKHFPFALIMVLIVIAAIVVMWHVPFMVFCLPAIAVLLFSLPTEKIMRIYTPKDETGWYSR